MDTFLNALQNWMTAHAHWAGFIVFLVAFTESLAVVGILVPGAFLLFTAGAMIGAGMMEFWPTFIWATIGAILGDNLSYWLGYYFRDSLHQWWPFTKHPHLIEQGKRFFHKHGGKSVALGRFVGPIRAVIPAVAGLLHMRPWTFLFINIVSAIAWAPAYLLPGVVLGTSLKLASEVAGRLVLFIVVAVLLLWFTFWISKRIYSFLAPRAERIMARFIRTGGRNRLFRFLSAAIVDPDQPETRGLFSWAVILILAVGCFVLSLILLSQNQYNVLDINLYQALQALRTPLGDRSMLLASFLGDRLVLALSGIVVAVFLFTRHQLITALHWGAALLFAYIASSLLSTLYAGFTQPSPDLPAFWRQSRFQIDITMTVAYFGFLAILTVRHIRERWKPVFYGFAGVTCTIVIGAKLYLGVVFVSAALMSAAAALVWIALLGIAYRYHHSNDRAVKPAFIVALVSFVFFYAMVSPSRYDQLQPKLTVTEPVEVISGELWWTQKWRQLPHWREDIMGRHHPLTVQWAGELATLEQQLKTAGWQRPVSVSPANMMLFISPQFDFDRLPVLPQVYRGRHEAMILAYKGDNADALKVLRLWRTATRIQTDAGTLPLYIGNVSELTLQTPLGLINAPHTENDFVAPLRFFMQHAGTLDKVEKHMKPDRPSRARWHGTLVLLRARAW